MSDYTYEHDYLKCPYCGHINRESFELGDGGEGCGETECGHCEREFKWERRVSVSYYGRPIEKEARREAQ